MASDRRIAGLDGLRGLAILSVLLHHVLVVVPTDTVSAVFYLLIQAGWIGVDLFFVLSGFLITTVLLRLREQPRFAATFYARRALRIFPVYYGFLCVVSIAFGVTASAAMSDLPWHAFFLTNFLIVDEGSFLTSLNHLWTLAVEEQFYLVWPWLVGFTPIRRLPLVCSVLALLALAFRFAWVEAYGGLAPTVMTPMRMDSFALGALVATLPAFPALRWTSAVIVLVSSLGLGAVVYESGALYSTEPTVQKFGFALLATLFAALIAFVVHSPPHAAIIRFLENRVLRFLGKISFALYVFHYPIQALLLPLNLPFAPLVSAAVSIGLATLSWHLIERRLLAFKARA